MSQSQAAVGQYLGRDVSVTSSSILFGGLAPGSLAHASVLLWLSTDRHTADFRLHLRALVAGAPLVLFVAGPGADEAFDSLLHGLADAAPVPHTMTRASNAVLPECLEEFLQATWPSDDRFDDWTKYVIVAEDGEVDEISKVTSAVLTRCGRG